MPADAEESDLDVDPEVPPAFFLSLDLDVEALFLARSGLMVLGNLKIVMAVTEVPLACILLEPWRFL